MLTVRKKSINKPQEICKRFIRIGASKYNQGMQKPTRILLAGLFVALLTVAGYWVYRRYANRSTERTLRLLEWLNHPENHPGWAFQAGSRCGKAPFLIPTDGLIGYLWGDSFQIGHPHQGIDIFGGTTVGKTPVVAAYAGYLTRLPGWKASLIVRIPSDPFDPQRQIWMYYTHLADPQGNSTIAVDFSPGTAELPVAAGTLLGYQGNYSGTPGNPTGVHLHFSIVKDDGKGRFLNELEIQNTLDPSPYLGLSLDAAQNPPPLSAADCVQR